MTENSLTKADRLNYTFGLGTYKALSIATAIVVAYLLQSEGYGLLSFAQATAVMVASVGSLAVPTLLTREVAQRNTDRATIFRSSLLITSSCVVLATLLLLLFTVFFVGFDELPAQLERLGVPIVLCGSAIYALGQVVSDLVAAALLAQKRSKVWSRWLVLQSSVVTAASILASFTNNAAVVLLVSGGAQLAVALVGLRMMRRSGLLEKADFGALRGETFRQLRLTVAPGLASQSIAVATWFTTMVLAAQDNGVALIGWYTIAYKVAAGLAFLPEAAVTARTTLIYENVNNNRFYQLIRLGLKDSVIIGLLTIAAVVVGAQFVTVLGDGYAGAEPLIIAMSLTIPLRAIQNLLSVSALALHRSRVWSLSYLAGAVVYVLGLASVSWLGGVGVALAAISSYLVEIIMLGSAVSKKGRKSESSDTEGPLVNGPDSGH